MLADSWCIEVEVPEYPPPLKMQYIFRENPDVYNILLTVGLTWCSSSVMDCHAMIRGSIPGGNGVKTKQGTVNGVPSLNDLAVDGTLITNNQPTVHCKSIKMADI